MSAQQVTVWELRCDGCNELLDDPEYGSTMVAESVDRIREIGAGQEWSQDGDTDLCPSCTCARVGHDRQPSITGSFVYCGRCSETLLTATAEPKAAFL
ncbi:hypothetical protein [Mycolicibacterium sp. F2034L]|uniref:hypothetical protein n=1 Tax=Mycolicibacterium sp. F2034L TaxID=2926422 RepID=UPI001FF6D035|nr:hypothetical protein [Mycolicibacterium sp. F2034L]MCK0174775.1 hypothetical protein [Mycolicibacterium sp. F2034L]